MCKYLFTTLYVLATLATASAAQQAVTSNQKNEQMMNNQVDIALRVHPESSELLCRWFDDPSDTTVLRKLMEQPGTQIMAEEVKNYLQQDTVPSYPDALHGFLQNHDLQPDPFGIAIAWKHREKSLELVGEVQRQDVAGQAAERLKYYIPSDYPLLVDGDAHLVMTGWEWGDAYVRSVRRTSGGYRIAEDGEPVIIINLARIIDYGDTDGGFADEILQTMIHEGFHLAFAKYREVSQAWAGGRDTTVLGRLVELIQDEGMAHYLSHHQNENLAANYGRTAGYTIIKPWRSPEKLKEYENEAFRQLGVAARQLADPSLGVQEKDEILGKANAGNYWSKYGSIAGLFMAYHIERTMGASALKESIAHGALSFLEKYDSCCTQTPGLPQLPIELKAMIIRK